MYYLFVNQVRDLIAVARAALNLYVGDLFCLRMGNNRTKYVASLRKLWLNITVIDSGILEVICFPHEIT